MSKTLTLAADLTGVPLSRKNDTATMSIPSGTVVTFPDISTDDELAERLSIISPAALKNNIAVLNHAESGTNDDDDPITIAVSYGPFAVRSQSVLGVTPTVVSAVIENAAADTIVLTFSDDVVATNYGTGFSCTVATVARSISSGTRQTDHSIIHLVLASPVTNGQAVVLAFTTNQFSQAAKTGSDLRAEADGAYIPSFSGLAVTNNVAP